MDERNIATQLWRKMMLGVRKGKDGVGDER